MLRRYRQVVCDHIGQALSWSDQDFVVIIAELPTHSLKNSWESYFFSPQNSPFCQPDFTTSLRLQLNKNKSTPLYFCMKSPLSNWINIMFFLCHDFLIRQLIFKLRIYCMNVCKLTCMTRISILHKKLGVLTSSAKLHWSDQSRIPPVLSININICCSVDLCFLGNT